MQFTGKVDVSRIEIRDTTPKRAWKFGQGTKPSPRNDYVAQAREKQR